MTLKLEEVKLNNIYLDTETSDLKPGQIGQLSLIIESEAGLSTRNYYFSIKSITDGAAQVTGRSVDWYERASGGKKFAEYADEIYNIINNQRIIAHNVKFDESFISMELWRCNKTLTIGDRFDTMTSFRNITKIPSNNGYKNPKLQELVNYLNINTDEVAKYAQELFSIETNDYHDAIFDTTSMYIACKVWTDIQSGTTNYIDRFQKK